jgi:4-amino-4-deoxy-L-arabinose transferase-like glycosyltransferase
MSAAPLTPLAVFVVVVLLLVPDLGGQNVWSKDEARDGLVARDMVERGSWLIPHIGGRVYPYKPPLFHWLVALLSPRGVTEWSLRVPSVLAAGATAAMTFAIGRRLVAPGTGLVAAAVLVSSPAFVEWARTGRLEMLLVFWITLGAWSAMRWLQHGQRRHVVALGLALGFGCLTKGPVGLLPLIALLATLAILGRWSRRSAADLGIALALALAIPLAWLGLAASAQAGIGSYVGAAVEVLGDETRVSRARHAFYAAEAIAVGFLPWTFLIPGALVVIVRAWRGSWQALLFPLSWAGFVLLSFTLFISPRAVYFLPMYPALALVVAWAWSTCSARERRWMSGPLALAAIALVVFGLGTAVSPVAFAAHRGVTEIGRGLGLTLAAIGAFTLLAALVLLRRRQPDGALAAMGLAALAVMLVLHVGVFTPLVNRAYPTRQAAARLAAALSPTLQVAYLDRKFTTGLMFYLPQRPVEVAGVGGFRGMAGAPQLLALLPHAEMVFINGGVCLPTRPLRQEGVFGDQYVLVDFKGVPARWCLWPPGY